MIDKMDQTIEIASHLDVGSLGILHLKRYWSKLNLKRIGAIPQDAFLDEWNTDTTLLAALGLGLEQTIKYLYKEQPGFDEFEKWILALNNGSISSDKIKGFNDTIRGVKPLPDSEELAYVLTEEDWNFWNENGYFIIRNAVTKEDCNAAIDAMCSFLEIDLEDTSTWYNPHSAKQGIMVQLFQHPALQKNRESAKIKAVYEQLWGRKDLWLNTDRVSFNPPETEAYQFQGPRLHWDVSLDLPIPFGLQGLLYLSDTAENQGAFTLVPGFHNRIEPWINSLPDGADPRREDLYALGPKPIAAGAGDFIVWHQALPHGSSPNTSNKPRLVQYINYSPVDFESRGKWK